MSNSLAFSRVYSRSLSRVLERIRMAAGRSTCPELPLMEQKNTFRSSISKHGYLSRKKERHLPTSRL